MVSDEELIEAVRRAGESHFAVTATDLVDDVDLTRQRVGDRLRKLCDNDQLERRKVGGNAVVYYLPEWRQALEATIRDSELSA